MVSRLNRFGFTVVELLVVVAVIGVIVALLIPAVQSARTAARRIQCLNNLKSIGVGIHGHAEAHGKLPSGGHGALCNSLLVQVLPYIEETALYNSINVSIDAFDIADNTTANSNPPSVYLCPSDASRPLAWAVNYAGNVGRPGPTGSINDGDGVFIGKPLAARDITDGLSATVGVSEWITGLPFGEKRREATSKYFLNKVYIDSTADVGAFVRDCKALDDVDETYHFPSKGDLWILGPSISGNLYNHMMTPNQHSCWARLTMDATTAGSFHGVSHSLTMDGSVHAVKDTIDPRVWSAAGSRAGGETELGMD